MAITNMPIASPTPLVFAFHIDSQSGTQANKIKFSMPYKARIDAVEAAVRSIGGSPTSVTVDLKDDGTTVLSSAITLTAGSIVAGTMAAAAASVAAASVMTIDVTFTGGTSPSVTDLDVLIVAQRE